MNRTNPKVDAFFKRAKQWKEEMEALRAIALDCGLTEELKWGKPCYTLQESNVVIIQGFKEFCALLFCKGALLKDGSGILEKPGENTQAARRIPFTSVGQIAGKARILKAYLREAVEAEEEGLEVEFKKDPDPMPDELQNKLGELPALNAAFRALTPGRQRAYILYFAGAKQSKTRASRVEKCIPRILAGKGLND
jgi:uncharacterized protein YdeI (YjbR/CyaY-like superfamily)